MRTLKGLSIDSKPLSTSDYSASFLFFGLSGDVALNPRPFKNACGTCGRTIASNHIAIQCEWCDSWTHITRGGVTPSHYTQLVSSDEPCHCKPCETPTTPVFNFSNSFFERSTSILNDSSTSSDSNLYKETATTAICLELN